MILLGGGAGAMGRQDSSGTAIGIFTLIGLVIAFLAAGYVAGALGVRGGLFHGFATWATSLIAVVIMVGWLGSSLLGTAGTIVECRPNRRAGSRSPLRMQRLRQNLSMKRKHARLLTKRRMLQAGQPTRRRRP